MWIPVSNIVGQIPHGASFEKISEGSGAYGYPEGPGVCGTVDMGGVG